MRKSGQSLLEASCGLVVIVSVVISLIDLAVVIYGVSLNAVACRNAARTAAAGNPDEAEFRARVAVGQSGAGALATIISAPALVLPVEVNLTSQPVVRPDPETDRPSTSGGLVTGTIAVETQVEIRPFAMDFIFRRREPFIFRSVQSFPIHYIVPAS